MRYKLTCLTPTLIGDGQKLAPIDYMVWRDQVNVLDQRRIFRMLSKGPRLDGYLAQLKKAEKLDFASWGGFAQNFAGRRIAFEHTSSVPVWERTQAQYLFIPTFASTAGGAYIPATAIKGALHTGAVADRWNEKTIADLASRLEQERMRNPGSKIDDLQRMRRVGAGDSDAIAHGPAMKVYLVRVATLVAKSPDRFELGWKSQGRTVEARRMEDATPLFAEMATPGTAFSGVWRERSEGDRHKIFQSANRHAAALLAKQKQYATWTGLGKLAASMDALTARASELANSGNSCMLSIGWGGGLLGKSGMLETGDESYRQILRNMPFYQRAIQTGLPFPKTRRVIFEGSQPSTMAGWVLLEVA
jgi:CRISPR-associated protein Csm5